MSFGMKFDIEKSVSAIAFLMERQGGCLDMFLAIKMLYLADKQALIRWGKTITGDSFVSLPKGPVLTKIYNLFKGNGSARDLQRWKACFSERVNHSIHLLSQVDVDLLSEREKEALDEARLEVNNFAPWDVADWLHATCPEWTDPNGSSLPIDPIVILENAGRSEQEIANIVKSNQYHNQTLAMLGLN
jgi:uncharacterized phage-associated protein